MKYCSIIIVLLLLAHGKLSQAQSPFLNKDLSRLIDSLKVEDQKPAQAGQYKDAREAEKAFKEITQRHIPLLKNIIKKYGFPGYDLVGKESSNNFWMLVQHSDADLSFQKQVIPLMEKQVKKKNASGDKYAYLIDRIRINEGGKQVYGTQIGWAAGDRGDSVFVKPLDNPEKVDERRKTVGLMPQADYLKWAMKMHEDMNKNRQQAVITFNQSLADSLSKMKDVDQIAAYIPTGKYKELSPEAWQHFKDSVFGTHQRILENIFNRYGYPGYTLVGKDGSQNFWLMVQHCDKTPAFQEKILTAMKKQVEQGNANSSNYAYLVDRVMLNTGRKQVYGTQVMYNQDSCQALPRPLQDSLTVNARRKEMGLESIEAYLNGIGTSHFEMNKSFYEKKGITKAKLYTLPQ